MKTPDKPRESRAKDEESAVNPMNKFKRLATIAVSADPKKVKALEKRAAQKRKKPDSK